MIPGQRGSDRRHLHGRHHAALVGLTIGTVGLDPGTGVARYTPGAFELHDGFDPNVALVGLFAISEVLVFLETSVRAATTAIEPGRTIPRLRDLKPGLGASLRGSLIGFVAGIQPGAGASLGAVMSYTAEKRLNDRHGTFGKGDTRAASPRRRRATTPPPAAL